MGLHFTTAFLILSYVISMLLDLFWCQPISRNWGVGDPAHICNSYVALKLYYVICTLYLLTDLLIYNLPFVILPALTLSARSKIPVALVFGLGLLCILASIARIITMQRSSDFVISAVSLALEQSIAIVFACCPPLKWLHQSYKYSSPTSSEERGSTVAMTDKRRNGDGEGRSDEFGTIHFRPTGSSTRGAASRLGGTGGTYATITRSERTKSAVDVEVELVNRGKSSRLLNIA